MSTITRRQFLGQYKPLFGDNRNPGNVYYKDSAGEIYKNPGNTNGLVFFGYDNNTPSDISIDMPIRAVNYKGGDGPFGLPQASYQSGTDHRKWCQGVAPEYVMRPSDNPLEGNIKRPYRRYYDFAFMMRPVRGSVNSNKIAPYKITDTTSDLMDTAQVIHDSYYNQHGPLWYDYVDWSQWDGMFKWHYDGLCRSFCERLGFFGDANTGGPYPWGGDYEDGAGPQSEWAWFRPGGLAANAPPVNMGEIVEGHPATSYAHGLTIGDSDPHSSALDQDYSDQNGVENESGGYEMPLASDPGFADRYSQASKWATWNPCKTGSIFPVYAGDGNITATDYDITYTAIQNPNKPPGVLMWDDGVQTYSHTNIWKAGEYDWRFLARGIVRDRFPNGLCYRPNYPQTAVGRWRHYLQYWDVKNPINNYPTPYATGEYSADPFWVLMTEILSGEHSVDLEIDPHLPKNMKVDLKVHAVVYAMRCGDDIVSGLIEQGFNPLVLWSKRSNRNRVWVKTEFYCSVRIALPLADNEGMLWY